MTMTVARGGSPARHRQIASAVALLAIATTATALPVVQTNLASDISGLAAYLDSNLVNPWGIASSAGSPFWLSDNGTGVSTLYDGAGAPQALTVTVPPPGGTSASSPTGIVFNGNAQSFGGAPFIFATRDGTIASWSSGTSAALRVDNSSNAAYTGLASDGASLLYAANNAAGRIDVFDTTFSPTQLAGNFTDPTLPSGYAPFGIQNLGGSLYVTYAPTNLVAGTGNGIIDVFDTSGTLQRRLVTGGDLDLPWGLALAPSSFGSFAGDLLVGNFGDGTINAFDPLSGVLQGSLTDANGSSITIPGLLGLRIGNGGNGGSAGTLYFAAGIPGTGAIGDHGLFGSLAPVASTVAVPEPSTLLLLALAVAGFVSMRHRRPSRR